MPLVTRIDDLLNRPVTETVLNRNDITNKDQFLLLLVTQLKNQDPLNPMESQEFAVQLAQFSQVEQLLKMNTNLSESIQASNNLNTQVGNSIAAAFLGKEVRAEGNIINHIRGEEEDIKFSLQEPATEVTVEILNSLGNVVERINEKNMMAGEHTVRWKGVDGAGGEYSGGKYTFNITAKDPNGNDIQATPLQLGKVEGIKFYGDEVILIVEGNEVKMSDVKEVFEPNNKDS